MTSGFGRPLSRRTFDHPDAAGARALDQEFERGLAALAEYARRYGDTEVEPDRVDAVGFPLGVWVAEQRLCYLEDRLPAPHRCALESVPNWRWERVPRAG